MRKGTFSELGSAQRCHRLGYEKYNFYRKGSVFQVLMEKNYSMFRVAALFMVLSSILLFKHRYPVGGVPVYLAPWAACPPGVKIPAGILSPGGGGKISRGIFTPTLGILPPTVFKIKFVFFDTNFNDK